MTPESIHFSSWFDGLGYMAWPLLACSMATLALVAERGLMFLAEVFSDLRHGAIDWRGIVRWRDLPPQFEGGNNNMAAEGLRLLWTLHRQPRPIREEAVNLWLDEQRARLLAHVHWLGLISVIAPLLGLMGTVGGMITAFRDLVASPGPVTPQLLADGLQTAMTTTAVGLAIAVPASVAAHGFRIWGENRLARLGRNLARIELRLAGLATETADRMGGGALLEEGT